MDERRLKAFVAVYEEGSVSAAALRLHMTQPPLSILLRKLEDELGVHLFDRSGHRLNPTATGELFYLRAKHLLSQLKTMRRELRELEQGARGVVHIGCATAASLFLLPKVVQDIRDLGLDIVVHVQEGEAGHLVQCLRERSLDLVISRSQFTAPELQTCFVQDEPLRVALPPGHRLAHGGPISLAELRNERFLLHRSPLGTGISDMVLRACYRAGYTPNVVYWGGETLPMLLMVQKGLGIAFAPKSFAHLNLSSLPVLAALDTTDLRTQLHLIWPRRQPLSPAADRVRALIQERFAHALTENSLPL